MKYDKTALVFEGQADPLLQRGLAVPATLAAADVPVHGPGAKSSLTAA